MKLQIDDIVIDRKLSAAPMKAKVIHVSDDEIITKEANGLQTRYAKEEFKFLEIIEPSLRKTVSATTNEPANEIIKRAGVETIKEGSDSFWVYEGKKRKRPPVNKWEESMRSSFGIEIKYAV